MSSVLRELQASLKQLVQASMAQTEAFNSLKKDLLLQTDPVAGDDSSELDEIDDSCALNLNAATENLLDSSNGQSTTVLSAPRTCSDSEPKADILDSLTQALSPNSKKFPTIEEKIAGLVDNILTGELAPESVKERGERYPPPAYCKYLSPTTVNEEIWDLLSRKNRTVHLAFQRVQEPLIHGLSSLTI